jgi:hypothetical protein
MPYPPSPARLSPESLRTTRFTGPKANSGSVAAALSPPGGAAPSTLSSVALELVADEAADDDVLADPLDGILQEVADGLVRLLDVVLGE